MSNPSLILPQSPAYGEDYVYAAQVYDGEVPVYDVLPLTFTRASGGSRINKDGLVQNMPYNLLEQSNAFSTSPWSKSAGTTLTSGQTDANGGTTAFRMQMSSASNYLASGIYTVVSGSIYIYTIYIKSNTGSSQSFRIIDGVRGVAGGVLNGTATTSWQRFELQITPNSTSGAFQLDNAGGAYANDLLICFAQSNIGSTAQPYLATTDRLNMPRITYPVNGGCGALLLEKQSTNLTLYSEQFDNAAWSTVGSITITANNATSPDGTQNADLFSQPSSSAYRYQNLGVLSGTITTSIFVKKGSQSSIAFGFVAGGFTGGMSVKFNLDTQTFSTPTNYANFTSISATYESYGNGWYRLNLTGTTATSTTYFYVLGSLLESFAVNAYLWGAQVEASSYPTSYISTTTASSTRIADACYKTGISNLIGQTEGTLYVDAIVMAHQDSNTILSVNDGSTNEYMVIGGNSSGQVNAFILDGGTLQVAITSGIYSVGTRVKCALAYKTNDVAYYINGVQIGVSTSATMPTTNQINIGSLNFLTAPLQGTISESVLYTTRLTNAQLATLTTL